METLFVLAGFIGPQELVIFLVVIVVIYLFIKLLSRKPKSGSQKFRGGLNERIGRR